MQPTSLSQRSTLALRRISLRPTTALFTPSVTAPSSRMKQSQAQSQSPHLVQPQTRASSTTTITTEPPPHQQQQPLQTLRQQQQQQHQTKPQQPRNKQQPPPGQPLLPWSQFFTLRTLRRRLSLASSLLTSLTAGLVALPSLLSTPNLQVYTLGNLIPDPIMAVALLTLGTMGLGFALGAPLGTFAFRLFRGRRPVATAGPTRFDGGVGGSGAGTVNDAMVERERDFFARVKRHRVDPAGSSVRNPIPDFYGEKVTSVADYRRWLKDQRAFNRKRGLGFGRGGGAGADPHGVTAGGGGGGAASGAGA